MIRWLAILGLVALKGSEQYGAASSNLVGLGFRRGVPPGELLSELRGRGEPGFCRPKVVSEPSQNLVRPVGLVERG